MMMKKILVIDDNKEMLNEIIEMSSLFNNVIIYTAMNVDDAIKEIKEKEFDVILSDCILDSNLNAGVQLFHDVVDLHKKELSERTRPFYIFMSGQKERLDSVKTIAGSTFLEKPFTPELLRSVVNDAIQTRDTLYLKGEISNVNNLLNRHIEESHVHTEILKKLEDKFLKPEEALREAGLDQQEMDLLESNKIAKKTNRLLKSLKESDLFKIWFFIIGTLLSLLGIKKLW